MSNLISAFGTYLVVVVCLWLWLWVGYKGFIFWWTHDFDFKLNDRLTARMSSILGPFTWLVGYFIHGLNNKKHNYTWKVPDIIVPKRKKKNESI